MHVLAIKLHVKLSNVSSRDPFKYPVSMGALSLRRYLQSCIWLLRDTGGVAKAALSGAWRSGSRGDLTTFSANSYPLLHHAKRGTDQSGSVAGSNVGSSRLSECRGTNWSRWNETRVFRRSRLPDDVTHAQQQASQLQPPPCQNLSFSILPLFGDSRQDHLSRIVSSPQSDTSIPYLQQPCAISSPYPLCASNVERKCHPRLKTQDTC
jgi:hypothetical protein